MQALQNPIDLNQWLSKLKNSIQEIEKMVSQIDLLHHRLHLLQDENHLPSNVNLHLVPLQVEQNLLIPSEIPFVQLYLIQQ
jgi:hypothetical protein